MTPGALLRGVKLKLFSILRPLLHGQQRPASWQGIGSCLGSSLSPDGLVALLRCGNGTIAVSCLQQEIIKIDIAQPGDCEYRSYSVETEQLCRLQLTTASDGKLTIRRSDSAGCLVRFDPAGCTLTFSLPDRQLFTAEQVCHSTRGWVKADFRSPAAEKYLGFGQKTGGLFKNNTRMIMWNTDDSTTGPRTEPLYQSCPLQLALRPDGTAWGIFFDNPHYCLLQPGDDSTAPVSRYRAAGGPLRYYVFPGPGLAEAVKQYTALTGRYPLPPRWVLGHHHSRWEEPESAAKILELAARFRNEQLPCDVLHLDIGHLNDYRCFTWHPRRFPDPAGLVQQLHARGFKVVVIADPGLKRDKQWPVYTGGIAEDAFCKTAGGRVYHGPVWPGAAAFVEYTRSRAAAWWGRLYKVYTDAGVDGFWNDMNEPAIFTLRGTMPDRVMFRDDAGHSLSHKTLHNVFSLLMAKASVAGLRTLRPGQRQFLFCRSSFAGIQRYASTWTGDNSSNWEHLRMSIPMLLNMGLSGQVMCGPDIGGFWKKPTPELMIRWIQLATFYPFHRNHTSLGAPPQEFWNMGPEVKTIARQYLQLRYSLLPYLYTQLADACHTGLPLMRPLLLDYPGDPVCLETTVAETQFLAGSKLLAAPVLEPGRREREVYLPGEHDWIGWHDGLRYAGGRRYTVAAQLDSLPLFIKSGSVIPVCEAACTTEEAAASCLSLLVYPHSRISGRVYLDDGQSMNWQQGDFSLLHLAGTMAGGIIKLELRKEAGNSAAPFYYDHNRLMIKIHQLQPGTCRSLEIRCLDKQLAAGSWQLRGQWLEIPMGKPGLPLQLVINYG